MAESTANPPKITLHWLEVSRSHRILWLLEELKIPYELKTWKRGKDKLADPKLKEVHPLGKSPVVTIEVPGQKDPIVLIESANIVEYLCDYYGKWLVPKRYQDGKDGQIGGETEAYLRYRTLMHYAEGSIMPFLVFSLVAQGIKEAPVPFFIRPITNRVASGIYDTFLTPNFKTHFAWLESQMETAPEGGPYLCGKEITAADIMMSFPLEAGEARSFMNKQQHPRLIALVELMHQREAFKRSVEKIEKIEGSFKMDL